MVTQTTDTLPLSLMLGSLRPRPAAQERVLSSGKNIHRHWMAV